MKNSLFKIIMLSFLLNSPSFILTMSEELTGNSLVERLERRDEVAEKHGEDTVPSREQVAHEYVLTHPRQAQKEFLYIINQSLHKEVTPEQEARRLDLIKLFISGGIDLVYPYLIDDRYENALLAAIHSKNIPILKVILESLAKKDELKRTINQDLGFETPLSLVIMNYGVLETREEIKKELEIIELLLEYGADPDRLVPGRAETYAELVHQMFGKYGEATQARDESIVRLFDKYRKKWD